MSSPEPSDGKGPMSDEVDKFLDSNADVDEGAADDLRKCPPEVQRIVLSRGDLRSARNPSAALIARIRDARTSTSSGSGLAGGGGGGGGGLDPGVVDAFLEANPGVDESAAASLRSSPADVQRTVIARGDLTGARNPSSALLSRIRDAKSAPSGGAAVPGMGSMGAMVATGGMPGYPGYGMYPAYGMPGMYPGYGYPGFGMPGYGYPGFPANPALPKDSDSSSSSRSRSPSRTRRRRRRKVSRSRSRSRRRRRR